MGWNHQPEDYGKNDDWPWGLVVTKSTHMKPACVGLHVRKVRFCKELQPLLCMYTTYIIYIYIYDWMELDAYWRIYWEPGMLKHDEFPKKWWGKKM